MLERVDSPLALVDACAEAIIAEASLLERGDDRLHACMQNLERGDRRDCMALHGLDAMIDALQASILTLQDAFVAVETLPVPSQELPVLSKELSVLVEAMIGVLHLTHEAPELCGHEHEVATHLAKHLETGSFVGITHLPG